MPGFFEAQGLQEYCQRLVDQAFGLDPIHLWHHQVQENNSEQTNRLYLDSPSAQLFFKVVTNHYSLIFKSGGYFRYKNEL
jgi:hypothetical protein